jgi:adenylylsulfate kinase
VTGAVVWFTGLPQSGKSTLAGRVRARLAADGRAAIALDSDELRPILAPDLGYDRPGRDEFYRRLAALAALVARQGPIALVAATAPDRLHRAHARKLAPRFIEVHVAAPRDECERRDTKGLYRRAAGGDAPDLPGAGAPYEPPADPDVTASGGHDDEALEAIASLLASVSA